MNSEPGNDLSLYLVFGTILIGLIALIARKKEHRRRKAQNLLKTPNTHA